MSENRDQNTHIHMDPNFLLVGEFYIALQQFLHDAYPYPDQYN